MVSKIGVWALVFYGALGLRVAGASDAPGVPVRIIEEIVTVKTP